RNNPDRPRLMNAGRHDSDFAMARRNNSWTIWSDQARAAVLQELPCANHIESWNAFGDTDDKFDLCIRGFHDRIRRIWRWHEDERAVGASSIHRFLHAVEHRPAFVRRTAFSRSDAADNLRPVFSAALGVECALAPREALHDDSCGFIYKDAHKCLRLAATIRFVSGRVFRRAETKPLKPCAPIRRTASG